MTPRRLQPLRTVTDGIAAVGESPIHLSGFFVAFINTVWIIAGLHQHRISNRWCALIVSNHRSMLLLFRA